MCVCVCVKEVQATRGPGSSTGMAQNLGAWFAVDHKPSNDERRKLVEMKSIKNYICVCTGKSKGCPRVPLKDSKEAFRALR